MKPSIQEQITALTLNDLRDTIHQQNVAMGWWTNLETGEKLARDPLNLLMLVVTEIAESAEGVRKDLMDDHLPHRKMVEVELADAIIRIMDFAGGFDLDIGGALIEKVRYNREREDHKIENRKKDGGKKW